MNKFVRRAVARSRINSEYFTRKKGQKMSYPDGEEHDTIKITKEEK